MKILSGAHFQYISGPFAFWLIIPFPFPSHFSLYTISAPTASKQSNCVFIPSHVVHFRSLHPVFPNCAKLTSVFLKSISVLSCMKESLADCHLSFQGLHFFGSSWNLKHLFFIKKHDLTWPRYSGVGKTSIHTAMFDKETKTQKNHVTYAESPG